MSAESILIRGLEVRCHIGVPDEERRLSQSLWVDVEMRPKLPFEKMNDEISATVDYYEAAQAIKKLAAQRPRRLIETLATEIRDLLIGAYGAAAVEVTIRKKILPDTEWVAVRTTGHAPQ